MRLTTQDIVSRKSSQKIVVLTAYTHDVARIIDPQVDVILVGDSLGMVLYGFASTTEVTLPLMIQHARAVVKASAHALVVVDMPYGSVEHTQDAALANAKHVLAETGAGAVKIEGGEAMAATIAHLTAHGVPVMAHIGMMPQRAAQYGGFKVQGKTEDERATILRDAQAVQNAGAFAVVIEAVKEPIARDITAQLAIPTIGIGASPACDGQVLVTEDMVGLTVNRFKFVERFGQLGTELEAAVQAYAQAVRSGTFPTHAHCY
jgi:3-methyl-2-oxobutanoate hydroxymethyltransferase